MGARAALEISEPLAVSTNTKLRVEVFSDQNKRKRASIVGKTVKVWIQNPNASTWKGYTVTATTAIGGVTFAGYATITGASHTVTGDAPVQVQIDGVLKERFTVEFVTKAS